MTLKIGTQPGSHEISALLGKGGMGEVYRAHDTKLKREVAIKVLPDEFSRDEDRVSRFQREAEVLASLNHPNVAAIYDLQEIDGITLVDTLRGNGWELRGGNGISRPPSASSRARVCQPTSASLRSLAATTD